MRAVAVVLAVAIYTIGTALAFTHQEAVSFERGYKAGLAAAPPPQPRAEVNLDNACTAWFFATNIKAAKARMCKGN